MNNDLLKRSVVYTGTRSSEVSCYNNQFAFFNETGEEDNRLMLFISL